MCSKFQKFFGCLIECLHSPLESVLINQFVPPSFCPCFAFTGVKFRGMLHHLCDVWPMAKTCAGQSELVSVGAQID